jgi:hypothetical protein
MFWKVLSFTSFVDMHGSFPACLKRFIRIFFCPIATVSFSYPLKLIMVYSVFQNHTGTLKESAKSINKETRSLSVIFAPNLNVFYNSKYNYAKVQVVVIFYSYKLLNTFYFKVNNALIEKAKNNIKLSEFVSSKLHTIITIGALARNYCTFEMIICI